MEELLDEEQREVGVLNDSLAHETKLLHQTRMNLDTVSILMGHVLSWAGLLAFYNDENSIMGTVSYYFKDGLEHNLAVTYSK